MSRKFRARKQRIYLRLSHFGGITIALSSMTSSGIVRFYEDVRKLGLAFAVVVFCGTANADRLGPDQGGVLLIGDSMSLCGMGEHVSKLLHGEGPEKYKVVHAYMASGSNPLSWLKGPPYANVGTRSGYWEIHRVGDDVKQIRDTYGMRRGHRPGYHKVPKIEDLLKKHRPEVLIVQLGNCFHHFFPKRATKVAGKSVRQHYLTQGL